MMSGKIKSWVTKVNLIAQPMPASNKGVFGNDNSFAGCSADLLEAVESEKKRLQWKLKG